jgi:EAL domain-containing protein (putative c-di-GMP-specific phosphodiesterase class I)
VLHHQPQLGWDGVVRGFEALVRWRHDDLGLLPPRRFLPAAERAGLLSEVTTRVLQLALTDHAALGALCPGATISVNVPARDLLSQEFLPALARTLADTGVAPGVLLLEVAEPAPYPVPAVVELFGALGRLGVGVSLHEFGAGHSSLTALADSPGLREVKVDPTLVRRMTGDTGAERLVRAIVHAAHGLEVEVVAEGVEDAATVAAARRLACDRVQGFWFSAPLPLAEVGDWHARWLAEQPAKLPVLTP